MSQISWFRRPVIGLVLRSTMMLIQKVFGAFLNQDGSILIAAPQGFRFADNSSYFFRYLFKRRADCYYMVNRKEALAQLTPTYGEKIIYAHSFRAFKKFISASVLVYSYADWDFHPFQVTDTKLVINLWHSISIKKLGLATNMSPIHKLKLKKEIKLMDGFVASSKKEADSLFECFALKSAKILISGTPRNDYLINENPSRTLVDNHPELKSRTILYCPTYRNNGITNILPFNDFDIARLDTFLAENQTNLLVRKHHREWYYQKESGYDVLADCKNIFKAGQDEYPEVQELLPHIDILMTDYSGIYFDYLLLDRPLIFAPYDIDEFGTHPGFLFNYDEHTPGPKVYSTSAFMSELKDIFEGKDKYSNQRKKTRDTFHQYQDGRSSQRILDYIYSSLESKSGKGKLQI